MRGQRARDRVQTIFGHRAMHHALGIADAQRDDIEGLAEHVERLLPQIGGRSHRRAERVSMILTRQQRQVLLAGLGVDGDFARALRDLEEYIKLAKAQAEDGRVSVRNVRRTAKQGLEKLEKDGEVGKDDVTGAEKRLDGITKSHTDAIDEMLKHKEAELLEV